MNSSEIELGRISRGLTTPWFEDWLHSITGTNFCQHMRDTARRELNAFYGARLHWIVILLIPVCFEVGVLTGQTLPLPWTYCVLLGLLVSPLPLLGLRLWRSYARRLVVKWHGRLECHFRSVLLDAGLLAAVVDAQAQPDLTDALLGRSGPLLDRDLFPAKDLNAELVEDLLKRMLARYLQCCAVLRLEPFPTGFDPGRPLGFGNENPASGNSPGWNALAFVLMLIPFTAMLGLEPLTGMFEPYKPLWSSALSNALAGILEEQAVMESV